MAGKKDKQVKCIITGLGLSEAESMKKQLNKEIQRIAPKANKLVSVTKEKNISVVLKNCRKLYIGGK